MSVRPPILAVAIAVFALIVAARVHQRPYFLGAKILPVVGHPEATKYAQEFADSLSINTHSNTGAPLSDPYIYLKGGNANSPDGQFFLSQHELRNSYHKITLERGPNGVADNVLVLQEGDPGSGTSHNWRWSSDSKAVFIYGWGKPAGHDRTKLALIYLVEQRTLYSIDLSQQLSKRLNVNTNAPNHAMQRTPNKFAVADLGYR